MAKRKVVRGWVSIDGFVTVEKTTVDNVNCQSAVLLAGSSIDYDEISGEAESQFVVRRIILDMWAVGVPTALNLFRAMPYTWALTVTDDDYPSQVAESPWDGVFVNNQRRVLQVRNEWPAMGDVAEQWAGMVPQDGVVRVDLSYKGGFNVPSNNALRLWLAQAGAWLTWTDSDVVTLNYQGKVLLQKRKDG